MLQNSLKDYLLFKMTMIKSNLRGITVDWATSEKLLLIQKIGQKNIKSLV